jgi:hypothetical protein
MVILLAEPVYCESSVYLYQGEWMQNSSVPTSNSYDWLLIHGVVYVSACCNLNSDYKQHGKSQSYLSKHCTVISARAPVGVFMPGLLLIRSL